MNSLLRQLNPDCLRPDHHVRTPHRHQPPPHLPVLSHHASHHVPLPAHPHRLPVRPRRLHIVQHHCRPVHVRLHSPCAFCLPTSDFGPRTSIYGTVCAPTPSSSRAILCSASTAIAIRRT